MSDEDPYAVSSDSEDNSEAGTAKKPPPKINIKGHTVNDFKQIKESLTAAKNDRVRDEKTLNEIEELKRNTSDQLSRFKKDFEHGTIKNTVDESESASKMTTVERPTGIDKQTLSAFKDKFENMDTTLEMNLEERLRTMEKSLEGVGKENLATMKNLYETLPNKEFTKEQIDELVNIQRSEADKRRVLATFTQSEKEEEPKDCFICGKIVYPVEKIVASKRLYHTACFKCSKCNKKLRTHMLDILNPERAATFGEGDVEDETELIDDDEEFAVSSKPKQLGANVVRAGNTNIGDELQQLKSTLKGKKQNWEQSANEALHSSDRNEIHPLEEIDSGTVKANLDKFVAGGNDKEVKNEDDEEKRKQLEAIKEQVSEVKNKWKTGDLQKAKVNEVNTKDELEELRKGPKVRERFSENIGGGDITKSYDRSEIDTSSAAEARKSFLEGHAYQNSAVEKIASDLEEIKFGELRSFKNKFEKGEVEQVQQSRAVEDIGVELKNIKQAFEREVENLTDMSPEARAERKKREIEAEFLRYKMVRKLQAKRQAEQANEDPEEIVPKEEIPSAEVGSIKCRFEAGEAFKSETVGKSELDVDIKFAGKAREKFKKIESESPQTAPVPKSKEGPRPSKWDKKANSTTEVVNRRADNDISSDEDEDSFDVKNLMNKFKNIENIAPNKVERKLEELEALKIEARNLRQRFEEQNGVDDSVQTEKKRQLEEEFRHLKEEREKAQKELEEERLATYEVEDHAKEEIQIAAEHASKMAAKWEKIHKKEAKKAQKSQMPQKRN